MMIGTAFSLISSIFTYSFDVLYNSAYYCTQNILDHVSTSVNIKLASIFDSDNSKDLIKNLSNALLTLICVALLVQWTANFLGHLLIKVFKAAFCSLVKLIFYLIEFFYYAMLRLGRSIYQTKYLDINENNNEYNELP